MLCSFQWFSSQDFNEVKSWNSTKNAILPRNTRNKLLTWDTDGAKQFTLRSPHRCPPDRQTHWLPLGRGLRLTSVSSFPKLPCSLFASAWWVWFYFWPHQPRTAPRFRGHPALPRSNLDFREWGNWWWCTGWRQSPPVGNRWGEGSRSRAQQRFCLGPF